MNSCAIIVEKVTNIYPREIHGTIYADNYFGSFIIEKSTNEMVPTYDFIIKDQNGKAWHFKNLDDYPKIHDFHDYYKLIKWAGEKGGYLFRCISVVKKNEKT